MGAFGSASLSTSGNAEFLVAPEYLAYTDVCDELLWKSNKE
jgi:hypothetical protein